MPKETVVLCDEKTDGHLCHVWAEFGTRGELVFMGQELTSDNAIMGYGEYEWTVTVEAANIPKLTRAIKARRHFCVWRTSNMRLLHRLRRRFSGRRAGREIQ